MTKTLARGEPPVAIDPAESLTAILWERAEAGGSGSGEILRYPDQAGGSVVWRGLTWAQLAERVTQVAGGLIALGVEPGHRVAIMAPTSVDWTVLDLAILATGAATVPIYDTDSPEQCEWILTDAGVTLAVAGSAEHAKNLELARAGAPRLGEGPNGASRPAGGQAAPDGGGSRLGEGPNGASRPAGGQAAPDGGGSRLGEGPNGASRPAGGQAAPDGGGSRLGEVFVLEDGGLEAIIERGTDADRAAVRERAAAVGADDLATIIYTSGTTGNPKGCVLTHANWLWVARQGGTTLRQMVGDDDSTLLFLPLAHSFARMIQFMCLQADVQIGYARSIDTLREDLASFSPTFLLAVPRVFEKVFNGAQKQATGAKAKVFDFAVRTAEEYSASDSPGLATRLKHGIADKLVYSKLRHGLGGRVRYCVSGGAPLAPHLGAFFHAAGITILEGYGLTETSAPATVNRPDRMRLGTVGVPLPGVEIRIADDGEILIKGGNVFTGYHRNDSATGEVLDGEGWFHSGDVGELDDDGFLRITGRKKELIVTAGGKNVAPAVLEERLKQHRLISQAMVVGDNKPFIGALITLDAEELEAFAKERSLSGSVADLAATEEVNAEVTKAVDLANAAVSRAESIRRWEVLDRDLSLEDKEITPTMKVRRAVVAEHFGDRIAAIYAGAGKG